MENLLINVKNLTLRAFSYQNKATTGSECQTLGRCRGFAPLLAAPQAAVLTATPTSPSF